MGDEDRKTDFRTVDRWLITAFLLAPSAWVLHLSVSYALVPESCGDRSKWMLHAMTLMCVALTLIAAAIAWKVHGRHQDDEKTRWMATLVVVLSFGMALVVIAQQVPNLILGSCQ